MDYQQKKLPTQWITFLREAHNLQNMRTNTSFFKSLRLIMDLTSKRRKIIWSLCCLGLVTLCIFGQMGVKRTLAQTDLPSILSGVGCEISCFLGIEPGVTTRSELENILSQLDIDYEFQTIGKRGLISSYILDLNAISPYILNGTASAGILLAGDTVEQIDISLINVSVSNVVAWFGAPMVVGHTGRNILVYPTKGLVFFVSDVEADLVDLVYLRTQLSVEESFADAAACIDQPTVCGVQTATLTPSSTSTVTATATLTSTPTNTPTPTSTPTLTLTTTPTPTLTSTPLPTVTPTITQTPSVSCNYNPTDVGQLRTAITGANSSSGADVICLTNNGLYTITDAPSGYNSDGPNGLPTITSNITIFGNNAILERGTSTPNFRLFKITSSGNLTLQDLTVRGGNPGGTNKGGAIRNQGTLNLVNTTITGNTAGSDGGGIYNLNSTLTATNSTISTNTSVGASGGGISNNGGTITLTNTSITGNSATSTATYSGGGISQSSGDLTINGGAISSNNARNGAGINISNGSANITGTLFQSNTATNNGGAIFINAGSVTIYDTDFISNSAGAQGGAISNGAAFTVTNSIFTGNSAVSRGGAVVTDVLGNNVMNNNCLSGNSAPTGSGVYSHQLGFNATNNYWGSASGPGGFINSNVNAIPFLTVCPNQ